MGTESWARSTHTGILCDFDIYQGGGSSSGASKLKVGGDVIIKLSNTLPHRENDNFFSSIKLVSKLSEKDIQYLGTIKQNRMAGYTIASDLAKLGRGSFDNRVENNKDSR
ncbi:hypothetical protein SNE40_015980 [Patella caerulea]|uniref:PiggyBac transposable element-derived protein domain-containing protein n=1 Tax=Patella caerulea TaxID=87958 RepID=A0AAN8PHW2_PATCE